jgi:thiamine-phosphate pyrophosphorylase
MRNDEALSLPELLLITPEPDADTAPGFDDFLKRLDHALASGIALVQLRAKKLDPDHFDVLSAQALRICRERGARLILNGPGCDFGTVDADGLHLSSERLMRCSKRTASDPKKLLSAACHTEEQLAQAERLGVDLVMLSPVLPTASHPGAPTLGWQRFGELVGRTRVPVYALGGMTRAHLATARAFGAQGIAAITGLWEAGLE